VALGYPLLEAEALRRRQPLLVEGGEPGRCAFAEVMGLARLRRPLRSCSRRA
jgi:hypothetical protein